MTTTEQSVSPQVAEVPEKKIRKWPRRAIGTVAVAGVAALASFGSLLMFRNNNMNDFEALRKFTSPSGQQDRCDMDEALKAQEQMRQHFAGEGVPEDQVPLVSDFVGLEADQTTGLLETELFQMPMDCEQPTASSNEATQGIIMVTAAGGIAIGAVGATLTRRRR